MITPEQGVSSIVNFVLPVLFFIYFRTIATDQELRAVLFAILIAGFAVGVYFVYDSYSMLVLKKLNNYSLKAFEYSQFRKPGAELNEARISIGYRSHGLLENHSVTAAWIVLGSLAALTFLPKVQWKKRIMVVSLYGTLLLIGLNFTGIVGFAFVILMLEYKGYILLSGHIPKRFASLLGLIIGSFILFGLILLVLPSSALYP